MTGEVKTVDGGVEGFHFFCQNPLDLVFGAAANAVDTQNNPTDIAVVRDIDPAGNLKFTVRKKNLVFHTCLL
jgi:hypothetical protein